jgi:hypothetical protein
MTKTTKDEIVCIKRQGFSILHTEGADFAAKVTHLRYVPGSVGTHEDVRQEMLIPIIGVYF